ncbi:MAG TPA: PAS domain S-box protein [Ignavibacteriaceae bacterium]|nr:PAS domain S-box protein [Ignavibacteriaceae bacterium]
MSDYKNLFDINPFPMIVYDIGSFQILDVNNASSDLYGYTRSELLSLKLNNLFYEGSLNEINTFDKVNGTSRVYHRKKDGTKISLKIKSSEIIFENKPARLETIISSSPEPAEDYLRLLFTAIVESSDDAIISKDLDGKVLSWNRGAEMMYGYKAEEVIGRNIDIIAPPDKKDEIRDIMKTLRKGEKYDHYTTRRQTKDGRILWVSITISPLKNLAGKIIGASAITRNISKAREDLARLQENDIIFKHLIENMSEIFYVSDPRKPEILYMSQAYEKVFGEGVQKIYEKPTAYLDLIFEEDLGKARRALAKQLKGESTDYTYRIKRADGSARYLRERAFPVKNSNDQVFRIIGIAEDITERFESEKKLRKSEYRYRSIFETTAVSLWETDDSEVVNMLKELKSNGVENFREYFNEHPEFLQECYSKLKLVDANPRSVILFKARSLRHLLDNMQQVLTGDFKSKFTELLIARANGGTHFETEYELKTFSGETIYIYSITNFPEEDSPYRYTVASLVDITERKLAERALSESEQRFRLMADTAPVLIWTSGTDGRFSYFNKPWLDFTGRSIDEEAGEGWLNRVHPIDLPSIKKVYDAAFESREEFKTEFRLYRHDGQERWLLSHGVPRFTKDGIFQGFIGSSVDITERKRNEVELSKALVSEKRALILAERAQEKLKYIAEAGVILNSSLNYTETLESLAKLLSPAICDWFAVDLYVKEKAEKLIIYHQDASQLKLAEDFLKKYPIDMNDDTGAAGVIKTGESLLIKDLDMNLVKENIHDKNTYDLFSRFGLKSVMIVPLQVRGRILGAITLCTAESGKRYDEDDLGFAENIAHRAATAIDNAGLFRQIEELNRNLEYTVQQQQKEIKFRKKIEKELRESEERLRLITENSSDFITLLDENDIFIYANPAFTRVLGYSEEGLAGKIRPLDLVHPEDGELLQSYTSNSISELRYKKKNGEYVWVESSILKVNYHGNTTTIGISRDITERKKIELERVKLYAQLETQRIRIDNLIANVPGVVWEAYGDPVSPNQKIDFISSYVEKLLGYTVEEWLNTPNFWYRIVHPDDQIPAGDEAKNKFDTKNAGINRFRWIAKDGRVVWVESQSTSICDSEGNVIGMRGVTMDITEQIKFEQQLSASLKEKEVLLKEVHHRVKNNMQIISSLLSLQSKTIPDKETQEIFDESRNRIRSMALIHEKLYQSKDFFRIDYNEYVLDLMNNLRISYGPKGKNVKAEINIKDISFDIDRAITLGLIINELASNAYKHAFKGKTEGKITVSVNEENGKYILVVKDNGNGIPENLDVKKNDTLGLQLVDTLIEQLSGKFELRNNNGTEARIEFGESERGTEREPAGQDLLRREEEGRE